ncbi:trypsin, alkaline B [Helicoverpa armigera]|uniref:trypsin, alkaline B n=1 Tax=Helicoverpa armigera TaxID=29058 RepID=UPI0030827340
MLKLTALLIVYLFTDAATDSVSRIAGGGVATINEYPFSAALLTNRGSGAYVQTCGGSIITANAILSAASCFHVNGVLNPATWWRARVGSTNANSGGTIYIINRITAHENFSPTTYVNDIAVLRTNLYIGLTPNLTAVANIAGGGYTYGVNQEVFAIGWGVTSNSNPTPSEQLQVAQVWLINQQTCQNRHSDTGFTVNDNMICAGWLDVGVRGQCAGDVGSPLLDSNGAVIGVFSRAQGCADLFYPDINTRVSAYTRWIIAAALA